MGTRRQAYLKLFVCSECPTKLRGEGGLSDSSLSRQNEDLGFDSRHSFSDERECGVRSPGLAGSTDLLVGAACTCIGLPCKLGFCPLNVETKSTLVLTERCTRTDWTMLRCIRRDRERIWSGHGLLQSDHLMFSVVVVRKKGSSENWNECPAVSQEHRQGGLKLER